MNPRSVEFLRTYAESLKILASSGGVSDEDANAIESIEWACELIEWFGELSIPRQASEWHEDMGCVLWWVLPVCEPPWCGQPHDSDWTGYHTHWTPLPPCPGETK